MATEEKKEEELASVYLGSFRVHNLSQWLRLCGKSKNAWKYAQNQWKTSSKSQPPPPKFSYGYAPSST